VPVTLISLPTCGFLFEGPVPEILIGLGLVLLLEHSSELFRKSEETCTHCLTVAPFSFRFDLQCSHMGGCVCRLSIYTGPVKKTKERKHLPPGSVPQTVLLYKVACEYEVALRKFLNEDPIMGEHVNFFNHHNKRSSGFVVGICEPEPAKSMGYDIEVPIPGKKGAVLNYKSVRRERIMRLRKYLVCDPRWLDYAARTSGFAKSEVGRSVGSPF